MAGTKYSEETREEAYLAFRTCGTIEGTFRLLKASISVNTLTKWKLKYDWLKRYEEDRANECKDLEVSLAFVSEVSEKFELGSEVKDILRETQIVSAICHATIMGEELPKGVLKPISFKEAVSSLKICWDTRIRVFGGEKGSEVGGRERSDFAAVHQYFGNVTQTISDKTLHINSGDDK